jgi:hypothetical protein
MRTLTCASANYVDFVDGVTWRVSHVYTPEEWGDDSAV